MLKSIIQKAFNRVEQFSVENLPNDLATAIEKTLSLLDKGKIRVAEKKENHWIVNQWIKKAILLLFKTYQNNSIRGGFTEYFDKVPLKFSEYNLEQFQNEGLRVVPPAIVRKGSYLAPNTILMPSYINIGAYVDSGTLVDTWATVGSCAQIGKNVHLSGGVGIGGVLEPLQDNPTIIENNCFIGARSEIVEGVIIEEGSVISMGVYIGKSTPIYNRLTDKVSYGRVPKGSVVVPGTLPSKNRKYNRYAAIIMKQVDEKTRGKISLNDLLREGES